MYAAGEGTPLNVGRDETLVINVASDLISKLKSLITEDYDRANQIAAHIYKLALLSQRHLSAEEMNDFLDESFSILERL